MDQRPIVLDARALAEKQILLTIRDGLDREFRIIGLGRAARSLKVGDSALGTNH